MKIEHKPLMNLRNFNSKTNVHFLNMCSKLAVVVAALFVPSPFQVSD